MGDYNRPKDSSESTESGNAPENRHDDHGSPGAPGSSVPGPQYRLEHEDAETIERVLALIASHLCVDDRNILWQVWFELARRHPDDRTYLYGAVEIGRAHAAVIAAQRDVDEVGFGAVHSHTVEKRRQALDLLVTELVVKPSVLLGMELDAYEPIEGTLVVWARGACRLARLSLEARAATDRWLMVRGYGAGLLFRNAAPRQPRIQPTSDAELIVNCRAPRGDDPSQVCIDADWVNALCLGQPSKAALWLLSLLLKHGHWSEDAIRAVARHAGCATPPGELPRPAVLSKNERTWCRAAMRKRWNQLTRASRGRRAID
jgi:hypothetical protein